MSSRTRVTIAIVLQSIASLFSLTSWVDPLEGGLAMTLGIGFTAASFFVGRVPIPKFTWITALAGIAFLVVFWALYVSEIPANPAEQMTFQPSATIMSLLNFYMVVSIAFICSTIFYAVVQFTTRRTL